MVKKTDYDTKVTEIENKLNNNNHNKYIPTSEFNILADDFFNARLARANLVTKTDFGAILLSPKKRVTTNKTKHLLVENELKKLKAFPSSCFIGKSHFEEDGTNNYLVFQPLNKYFEVITNTNTNYVSSWKSKGLSDENITAPTTSDYKLNPQLSYFGTKARLEFRGSYLKQDKSTFNNGKIVNIYIVYELDKIYVKTNPTLVNCLFAAVSITKNADIDKNKYSGYGNGFDRSGVYLLHDGSFGRNVIIFGVNMSSSVHVDNKRKDILILEKGPPQGLGEHSLTAEKMYSVNFTDHKKNVVQACIIMGQTLIYLLIVKKLLNLKQKILRLLEL